MTFIFNVLQIITFNLFHSITTWAAFSKAFTISLTELFNAIKYELLTNENNVTKKIIYNTLLRTLLVYINKKIGDTREY